MAVDSRHRDKSGEISQKGNTLILTLRHTYGGNFAKHCASSEKLSDVLTLARPAVHSTALPGTDSSGSSFQGCG